MVTNGLALAAHFGDGVLRPSDVAAGIVGAVVKDPIADGVVWNEYLEAVVRERSDWAGLLPRLPRGHRVTVSAEVRVFGIRHHGPGSARAVLRALAEFEPDIVLIEGPSDADQLAALAASDDARPAGGAARLCHRRTRDGSAFWPFAEFSPEWQALRWAIAARRRARAVLRPAAAQQLAAEQGNRAGCDHDPLVALAAAGGYDDSERWWDTVVESRDTGRRPDHMADFDAITEAMAALREDTALDDHTRTARGVHASGAARHAQGRRGADGGGVRRAGTRPR